MKKKLVDILSGVALILFAAFGWWQTSSWKDPAGSAGVSVKLYPRTVFAAIFICGVFIIVRTLIRVMGNKEDRKALMETFIEMHPLRVLLVVVLMVIYIFALKRVGFIISTIPMLYAFMAAFGERRWIRMAIISVAGTIVLWAFFVQFMHVHF